MTNSLQHSIDSNGIASITLNRPEKHNAFDDALIAELTTLYQTLESDNAVRVIILTGEGKSFSAGADLNWMQRMANYSAEENFKDSQDLAQLMAVIFDCSKPTIAAVNGPAIGGGVGLVACCDIAIASERSFLCLSEVKLGLIPAVISPYVIKAIGERQAKRYFLTAERIDAQLACSLGLVHEVTTAEHVIERSQEIAQLLLKNGPQALTASKDLINHVANSALNAELRNNTAQRIADIRVSSEGQDGIQAFLNKSKPSWL